MSLDSSDGLLAHVLVPVATAEDARTTAMSLDQYAPTRVTVLHVVEKAGGAPDKAPMEQQETQANESFAAFREVFPDAEDIITYRQDVVEGIFDVADEIEASAIAFRSRGGNRVVQFLAGDRALNLVQDPDVPIISLPRVDED